MSLKTQKPMNVVVVLRGLRPTVVEKIILKTLQNHSELSISAIIQGKKNSRWDYVLLEKGAFSPANWVRPAHQELGEDSFRFISGEQLHLYKKPCDFVLSLSDQPEHFEWARQYSRRGVIRFQFGETLSSEELLKGAWLQELELIQLLPLSNSWQKRVLKQGRLRGHSESLRLHLDGVWSAAISWLPAAILNLQCEIAHDSQDVALWIHESQLLNRPRVQGVSRLSQLFGAQVKAFFRKSRRLFHFQKWHVALIENPLRELLRGDLVIERKWLPLPGNNEFIADPFPVFHRGELKLLVEKFDFRTGKGVVKALSLAKNKKDKEEHAFEMPTHVSYPSMICEEGNLYCIPETLEQNEVAIYQCLEFPHKWKKVHVILKEQTFSDPSLFKFQNRWWMFATKYDAFSGGNDQLYAWSADQLFGDWRPHSLNPLKIDIGSARSAGMPFTVEGVLYRPSQDCTKTYGGAVVFNRVNCLSETCFQEEEEVRRILPDSVYPMGCHHIAGYGNVSIVDGRTEEFSLRAPVVKLSRHFWARARARKHHGIVSAELSTPAHEQASSEKMLSDDFKIQTAF